MASEKKLEKRRIAQERYLKSFSDAADKAKALSMAHPGSQELRLMADQAARELDKAIGMCGRAQYGAA